MLLLFHRLLLLRIKKRADSKIKGVHLISVSVSHMQRRLLGGECAVTHLKRAGSKTGIFVSGEKNYRTMFDHFKCLMGRKCKIFDLNRNPRDLQLVWNSGTLSHIRGRCCTTSLLGLIPHAPSHVVPSKTPSHHLQQGGNGLKSGYF